MSSPISTIIDEHSNNIANNILLESIHNKAVDANVITNSWLMVGEKRRSAGVLSMGLTRTGAMIRDIGMF